MTLHQKPSVTVWIGLILTILSDCAVQLVWKELALALPDHASLQTFIEVLLVTPESRLLAGIFLFKFVLWLWVIARVDLSFAQPLTSLSYVGVAFISLLYLHEQWHWQNVVSIAFILVGVYLVSESEEGRAS